MLNVSAQKGVHIEHCIIIANVCYSIIFAFFSCVCFPLFFLPFRIFNLGHFAEWARACRLDSAVMVVALGSHPLATVLIDHFCNPHQFACHAMMVDAVPAAANSTCSMVVLENRPQNLDKIPAKMDWTWHSGWATNPARMVYYVSSNSIHLHDRLNNGFQINLGYIFFWRLKEDSLIKSFFKSLNRHSELNWSEMKLLAGHLKNTRVTGKHRPVLNDLLKFWSNLPFFFTLILFQFFHLFVGSTWAALRWSAIVICVRTKTHC